MKQIGIRDAVRGKVAKTTIPDTSAPCPRDKLNRMFRAPAPNLLWVGDFTYVSTWQGFIYVAFVIDTFADRIVGPLSADLAMPNRLPVNGTGLAIRRNGLYSPLSCIAAQYPAGQWAANICPFAARNVWLRLASNRRSAASGFPMITLSLRQLKGSTKLSGYIVSGLGAACRIWEWRHSAGSIGSITGACLGLAETSRQPRRKRTPMRGDVLDMVA